ncbi:DOPA 4,5-dioxygenase family protein [Azotobacter vinelandii]|uniref:DOPA 4,5-dioxygenase family protein n=1 Tax=Azotobacter vinelandii TaxID=354 RepID=UPI000774E687|nr:DOPA 4,5-dioxygenase family protein [Azotobacter vinelandii]
MDYIVDISPLIFERVEPHTMPMFEIDIEQASVDAAVAWLDANRGGFSVLVHPVQEDEYEAHTKRAIWLGDRLALDLRRS